MGENNIEPLYKAYFAKWNETSTTFVRYLYHKINWSARIIGIKGARGTGKTTLLLQRIKMTFEHPEQAMYASLDNIWFDSNSLMDLVEYLDSRGVHWLFLDEVHKYRDWVRTLKNIYDSYPKMNIIYTGSSLLQIDHSQADLSRRQTLYTLNNLSFREYLDYEGIMSVSEISLPEITSNHIALALEVTSNRDNIMLHFDNYLRKGCYPFYKEAGEDYLVRLRETVQAVIDVDVPAVERVDYETLLKLRKLLMIMAVRVPFVPKISELCNQIASTRNQTLRLLYLLHQAGLMNLISQKPQNYNSLVKPDKVLLNNTNLMYCLSQNVDTGTLRETFFANQLSSAGEISIPQKGDYLFDNQYLFEVGGKGNSYTQIRNMPNSFLAVDETLVGYGNRIPLWLFGMMY